MDGDLTNKVTALYPDRPDVAEFILAHVQSAAQRPPDPAKWDDTCTEAMLAVQVEMFALTIGQYLLTAERLASGTQLSPSEMWRRYSAWQAERLTPQRPTK